MRQRLVLILLILLTACTTEKAAEKKSPDENSAPQRTVAYGNPQLLADGEWLQSHLDDTQVAIIDLRPQAEYESGHIPNAVQLDLNLVRATVDDIDGQVASATTVASVLGERGISETMTVVIYDDADHLDAARLFWTLEYYGHTDTRLLDGGWPAWEDANRPTSQDPATRQPTTYTVNINLTQLVDADQVLASLNGAGVILIDARSSAEYQGEEVRADHGGHIPGAFNMDWRNNLQNGFFKSQTDLEALYATQPLDAATTIIAYCQTGHRASVAYFTLRLMGYDNVAVYDGSWSEWGNRDDLPIASDS